MPRNEWKEDFLSIIEEMEDGYLAVDIKGNMLHVNQALCDLWGYSKHEMIGRSYREFMSKEQAEQVYQAYNQVFRTGKANKSHIYEATLKNGGKKLVEASVSLSKDGTGKITGFRGIYRDITERTRVQEELAANKSRLEMIFKSVDEGIITVDNELAVIQINQAARNICGLVNDIEIGQSFPSTRNYCGNACWDAFQDVLRTKASIKERGIECDRKDLPVKSLILSSAPMLNVEKKHIGAVLVMRDVTRLRALERAVRQEMIESAHRAGMADIASGTLHNVGNVLNSVKVSAQVIHEKQETSSISSFVKANNLLRDHKDDLRDFILNDPKGLKLLDYYLKLEEVLVEEATYMKSNIQRLNEKIDTIAEVIAAQQSFAGVSSFSDDYELNELVESALTLQSDLIQQYSIDIEKNLCPLPKIKIQKAKLIHILINLIKNAIESMVETPPEERKITISFEKSSDLVYLKIKDTGIGLSQPNLKKVFSHGFTTKKDGHGFGLHSSANYMTEMGGKMWAESKGKGKGATFVLQFKLS